MFHSGKLFTKSNSQFPTSQPETKRSFFPFCLGDKKKERLIAGYNKAVLGSKIMRKAELGKKVWGLEVKFRELRRKPER